MSDGPKMKTVFNGPDDSNVLVLQMGGQTEGKVLKHRHHDFLKNLKQRFGSTIHIDSITARSHLTRLRPQFILAVDGGFANREYRQLQDQIATNLKTGACLIMCCEFPRNVCETDFKQMILNRFQQTWELGKYRTGTYNIRHQDGIMKSVHHDDGIASSLDMAAVHLYDVFPEEQMYINPNLDGKAEGQDNTTPIALTRYNNSEGYIMFIGCLNISSEIQNYIFNFMESEYRFHIPFLSLLYALTLMTDKIVGFIKEIDWKLSKARRQLDHTPKFTTPSPKWDPLTQTPPWLKNRKATQKGPEIKACENCGQKPTSRSCTACHAVCFCSSACQYIGMQKHRVTCPATAMTLAERIAEAMNGKPRPLIELVIYSQNRASVLERLIDTYRIRVEDLNNISNIQIGRHRQFPGPSRGIHTQDFVDFLVKLHNGEGAKVRPEWWDLRSQTVCEDFAKDTYRRTCISQEVNDSDLIDYYEEKLMPTALRTLGDIIYGGPVPEPVDTSSDEETEGVRIELSD